MDSFVCRRGIARTEIDRRYTSVAVFQKASPRHSETWHQDGRSLSTTSHVAFGFPIRSIARGGMRDDSRTSRSEPPVVFYFSMRVTADRTSRRRQALSILLGGVFYTILSLFH